MNPKYKFPLAIPPAERLRVTQAFKSTELADFYQKNGIQWSAHPAIDVARETDVKTYGTPFVCPFPSATLDRMNPADAPNGVPGYIQIKSTLPDGRTMIIGGVHLSDVVKQDTYREGDVLGYVGNYGLVVPPPTIGQPFDGAHLHLVTYINGAVVNPLDYFDINNPYRAEDTGFERDRPAIQWAINKIKQAIAALRT